MQLSTERERFPIRGTFRISRGTRTEAVVVTVALAAGGHLGRGECTPYARYGESVEGVLAQIETLIPVAAAGALDRARLATLLPAGAARNAVDCALWDLEAKQAGRRVWELAGIGAPGPTQTAFTLSLDTPEKMAESAAAAAHLPLLKLKLTGDGDVPRVEAVRGAAPNCRLIVDANEAWSIAHLEQFAPRMAELGVEMIEQPLPAGADQALAGRRFAVPLGADESCHTSDGVAALADRYQVVNVKLDKTGGLTEALALVAAAERAGLQVMVGCMLGTSLAMAPARLLAARARYLDIDGPLLLAADRPGGLVYDGAAVSPPEAAFWG